MWSKPMKKHSMVRRSYLTVLGSLAVPTVTTLGQQDYTDSELLELEKGILVSNPNGYALSKDLLTEARNKAASSSLAEGDTILASVDSLLTDNADTVGYYVGYNEERGGLVERVWSKPGYAGEEYGRSILSEARTRIRTNTVTSFQSQSDPDPIDADPGWEYHTTFVRDSFAIVSYFNTTLGKVDLRAHLYQAPDAQGHHQYGCIVDFMSYPGVWLDSHEPDIEKGAGFQTITECRQDWTVGTNASWNDVDYSPTNVDNGWDNCSPIESIEIGVDGTAVGSITFTPDDGEAEANNISNPDDTVETEYVYGGFFRDSACGGEIPVDGGNAGIFLWDGEGDIVDCTVASKFKWEPPSGHIVNRQAAPSVAFDSETWS